MGSHQRAAEAWDAGRFDAEVVAPFGADLSGDECVRANTSLESLARLKPVFRPDGSGHRRQLVADERRRRGAAARRRTRGRRGWGGEPLARVVSRAVSGVEPHLYGIGPVDRRPARPRPGGHRLGRSGRGRAQRGVRRPGAGVPRAMARPRPIRSSTRTVGRSRSGIRSAAPAPGSSPRSPTSCAASAAAGASPRCASASARASPSCSTPTDGTVSQPRRQSAGNVQLFASAATRA